MESCDYEEHTRIVYVRLRASKPKAVLVVISVYTTLNDIHDHMKYTNIEMGFADFCPMFWT